MRRMSVRSAALVGAMVCTMAGIAGPLDKAFEALRIFDYFKARELFTKQVPKHPAGAWYGLSVITGRADNPFYQLDSALTYVGPSWPRRCWCATTWPSKRHAS